jgi:drug/metabolite transporter (DMT)-like permease
MQASGVARHVEAGRGQRLGSWALAGGLVAVVMWGLAPVATRALVAHVAPLPLLALRMGLASLVLLPWALPVFRRLTARSAGRLVAAGALGIVGYTLPVTVGLQWLRASTAGLLLASEPIWVMVIGRVFLSERRPARAWAGSGVALAGIVLLAGPDALTGGGHRALAGAGLVLAGTLAFGAYTIVLRPLSKIHGAGPATAASTVVGAVPLLAFGGTVSASRLAQLPPSAWAALAFLGLGSSVAGMVLWNRAVAIAGSSRVSVLLYLEPVVSVTGAVALLGEHVTVAMIAAGVLILAGVALASANPVDSGRGRRRMTLPQEPPAEQDDSGAGSRRPTAKEA